MSAYYNEFDPFAAAWLRELIKGGHIADGEVDERSIAVVRPDDLRGFTQCHFFAGIGGWSHALRLAGWPDDRAVWTGSCPCQPFSSAGAQTGGHDPRDLWPVWFKLIAQCRPGVVFGEQVEAAIGHGWLDRVCDDMEAQDYAVGACGLPAASVGAFHIRQRLWFVADTESQRNTDWDQRARRHESNDYRPTGDVADADGLRRSGRGIADSLGSEGGRAETSERSSVFQHAATRCAASTVADNDERRCGELASARRLHGDGAQRHDADGCGESGGMGDTDGERCRDDYGTRSGTGATSREETGKDSSAGFWDDVAWLPCSDGKARPVEPGTFPLAHGVSARVGRLRGYGNAIVPQVAEAFIEAYMSTNE